jgi:hypothetical protein
MPYQAYIPTWLPDDLIVKPTGLSKMVYTDHTSTSVVFSSSDTRFKFLEGEDPGSVVMDCGVEPINSICNIVTTPQGNTYKLVTSPVDDQGYPTSSSHQFIQHLRGGAYFYLESTEALVGAHAQDEWSRAIDSLQPFDARSLPVTIAPYVHQSP